MSPRLATEGSDGCRKQPRVACRTSTAGRMAAGCHQGILRLYGRDAKSRHEPWRRCNRGCRLRARVGCTPKRGTPGRRRRCRRPEPPAVLAVRRRMLRKREGLTADGSNRGLPAERAQWVEWPPDTACTPCGWVGRDASRPTIDFSPKGPTHKVGTCTVPMVPDKGQIGARWRQPATGYLSAGWS